MSKPKKKERFNPKNRASNNRGKERFSKSNPKNGNSDSNLPKHDTTHDNDISYWNGAGQLYVDATTMSSYSALGTKHASPSYPVQYYSPTGICRFDYVPFFGDVNSAVHPINTTAKIIYNAINAKNSRNPSYDPNDLMIYIIAVAQAWSIHAWVRRIVGMFNTFSVVNRYWWEPICESMGISPISTDNDIVKWRNLANHMALILNRLPVPNGIKYFDRTAWMNTNIYMDSPTGKATYYYFSPASILKYEYDSDQIGKLSSVETPWHAFLYNVEPGDHDPISPSVVESFFNDVISNLFNDSDIPVIGADIMRAFEGNIYGLGQLDSSFVIGPTYTPEVNLELHNARINYGGNSLYNRESRPYDLVQDMVTNTIKSTQVIWDMPGTISTALMATDMLPDRAIPLDFPIDSPGNDDWMIATRLTWGATIPDADHVTNYATLVNGTEMLIDDTFYEFETVGSDWELTSENSCIYTTAIASGTSIESLIYKLSKATKLHDAPIMYIITKGAGSAQYKAPAKMEIVSDLSNYTTISVEDLRNLHDVAQISIFLPEWLRSVVGK